MTESKTHYRKVFNSPYLSSADIVEPTLLTISHVLEETDKAGKKKVKHNTAYFAEKELRPGEKLKPMILNVGNCKVLTELFGSPFIQDWSGAVLIYVDNNVKFAKDIVSGLRIKAAPPQISVAQANELDAIVTENNISKDDVTALLNWLKCSCFEEIPELRFKAAKSALLRKAAA